MAGTVRYRHERYDARRCAFQALYAASVSDEDPLAILAGVDGGDLLNAAGLEFARVLLSTHADHADSIYRQISEATEWELVHESPVELSILGLAAAELISGQTPPAVVINEAVELAKLYASPAASGYINGMLRTIAERNAPAARPPQQDH